MIAEGRVIGLDLGSRRIGVAVTDSQQTVATPVVTIHRSGSRAEDHRAIASVVAEYEAVGAVVGLPVSLSGAVGPAAQAVLAEVEELSAALPVEVETVDERLTTVAATGSLQALGIDGRRRRHVIDQAAASELLQTWLDRRKAFSR